MMNRNQFLVGLVLLVLSVPSDAQIDRTFFWSDGKVDEFYRDAAVDRGAAAQYESLNKMRNMVRHASSDPPDILIPRLGEGLRKLSLKNVFQVKARVEIYDLVQSTLLSIPGHARYFADEIKREQKEVAEYPTSTGPRISYDRNRSKYFVTLSHLPSPETIAVLGEFLSDDIDTPRYKISPHSDWGESPKANSYGSAVALILIGLREPPGTKESYEADPDRQLAKTREWWDAVKSGRRTFSFKGQAVEYRFNPDGTWDTLPIANPPDDGPQAGTETTRERRSKRPETDRPDSPASSTGYTMWWLILSGFAFAFVVAWFWKKKAD